MKLSIAVYLNNISVISFYQLGLDEPCMGAHFTLRLNSDVSIVRI